MHSPVRILIVDDIESNLVALEALLANPSVAVVRARSGGEALAALQGGEFALILLDVQMPAMDGFDTAAAIRKTEGTRHLPIIFVTAHGSTQEQLARAYALGASDFIAKPVDPDALRSKVGVITDLWRMVNEVRRDAEARQEQRLAEERRRWDTEALRERFRAQKLATAAESAARVDAEKANTVKDEFLAILSHELRTPLHAILGWATLLKKRGPGHPSFGAAVDVIERNARAQVKLIDDMLDISRIVAGTLRLDPMPVAIPVVIDRAIETIRPVAERKRLAFSVTVASDLPCVAGDPDRLQQVLGNVLSNAVKFTPEDGRITVVAAVDGAHVRIAVVDTGSGISPEFLPHVFDRFRQGQAGPARLHGGLGIGLSLARKLIELQRGTIEAYSDGKGKGATLTIRLPIHASPPAEAVPMNRADVPVVEASLSGVRILVVDDEADARNLLLEVLESVGASVLAVESAAATLAVLSSWRPDVIVSDIGMPLTDGYALIREIRALSAGAGGSIPAVAVTAYTSADDAMRVRAAGFQAHLAKPVEPAALLSTVASLITAASR